MLRAMNKREFSGLGGVAVGVAAVVFATAAAVVMAGCTGDVSGPGPGVRLSETVRLPASEGALEVVVEPDTLRIYFEGEPPAYAVGEVVYGTEGPGYLRRITQVERDEHKLVLHTVDADFGEAFQDVNIEQVVTVVPDPGAARIAPTWRKQEVMIDGVRYVAEIRHDAPIAKAVPQSLTTSIVWEFPRLSITLTDPQGNLALQLSAENLRIEKQITLDVKVDFGFFKLKELRFVDEEDTHASISGLSVVATGALTLADVSLPVFAAPALAIVPVGPLVFTVGASVDLGASVGLSGQAEVRTTGGVGYHTWRRSGVTWDGGFHVIDESTADADTSFDGLSASAAVSASAEVSVTGALNVKLYGVAGPEVFAKVSPLVADMTFSTSAVDGTLSASASAGARFAFPFFKLAATSVTFASWSHEYGTFHRDF
jgi:hypothetical protein